MYKRRRSGPKTFWLTSQTFGVNSLTAGTFQSVNGSSPVLKFDLLNDPSGQAATIAPELAGGSAAGAGFWRQGPNVDKDLIIKTIAGKLNWALSGKGGTGNAAGVWSFQVRAMIFSYPFVPELNATELIANQSGSGDYRLILPDITFAGSAWATAPRTAPGTQVFWARTWCFTWDFGSQPSVINSEQLAAPAAWIACHPRKRIKTQQGLACGFQFTSVNSSSATGQVQLIIAPDLRVAGRLAYPRRN